MKNKKMFKILVGVFFILGLNVSAFAENINLVDDSSKNIEKIKGKYNNVSNKPLKSNLKSIKKDKKGIEKIKENIEIKQENNEEFALYNFLYEDRVVINVKKFPDANVAVGKYKIAVKNGSLNLLKKYRNIVDYLKINNINSLEKITEPNHFKQILEIILKNYKSDEEKLNLRSKNFERHANSEEFKKEQKNLQLKIKYVNEILNDEKNFDKTRQNYLKYVKEADIIEKTDFEKELNEILSNNNFKMNNNMKILEIEQGQDQELTFYRFLSTDIMDINVRRFSEDVNVAVERHKTIVRNGVLKFLTTYKDVMNYFKINNINNLEKIVEPGHFKQILELILNNYKLDKEKLNAELENLKKDVITDEIKLEYKQEKQKRIDDLKIMLNIPLKNDGKEDIEKEKLRIENLKKEKENLENNLENFGGDIFKEYLNRKKISLESELSYLAINIKHLDEILNNTTYFERARQNYLTYVKEADRIDKTDFEKELNETLK